MSRTTHLIIIACSLALACGPSEPGADTGTESTGPDPTGGSTPTTGAPGTGESSEPGDPSVPTGADGTGEAGTEDTGDPTAPPPGLPDMDGDGFADDIDLCPSIASEANTADSDRDGIGDACDLCPRPPPQYNAKAGDAGAPVFLQVRNIPLQADDDQDGIGDVCDNCVVIGNCGEFGDGPDQTPAGIGDVTPFDDASVCQIDDDELPYLGDACFHVGKPLQLPEAAGPVGLANADDIDQDGLANLVDRCPRVRVAELDCASDDQCPDSQCTDGRCNHVDRDQDGVGDACDSCPAQPNPKQVQDGGAQEDDPDGDFVGSACESHPGCIEIVDPAPIGFNTLAVDGVCCALLYDEAAPPLDPGHVMIVDDMCTVVDPALPLLVDCPPGEEDVTCRQLPNPVIERPGVVTLPVGCTAVGEPVPLASPGIDGDHDKLYAFACRMPVRDRDFDGLGDACDQCPDAFDPDDTVTFCTGDYAPATNQSTCP
jgi:hypothetical protein